MITMQEVQPESLCNKFSKAELMFPSDCWENNAVLCKGMNCHLELPVSVFA